MSKYQGKFILCMVMMGMALTALAQPKYNSPYSRLGLGDLFDQNFVNQSGLGGISTAASDPFHLNIYNPASYSSLRSTAFEVAMNARYSSLENTDGTNATLWGGNVSYFALGFPMRNPLNDVLDPRKRKTKWGMAFSLVPFTTVGYDIETSDFVPGADTIRYLFEGTGGTYRFVWGNSVKINNFSAGINLSYLFGKISREHQVLPDLTNSYQEVFIDEFSVSGLLWELGLQYDLELDRDRPKDKPSVRKVTFGATFRSNNSFNTNSSTLYRTFNPLYSDVDTFQVTDDIAGKGTLPLAFSLGAMLVKNNKYRVGLQYDYTQWDAYRNDAKPDDLVNSWRVAIGGEIIPDYSSYNKYSKKIRYRAGAFYGTDPRTVFNTSLTNYGINIGLGLPIILPRQRTSFVNVALELGRFGTTESLQETYAKLSVGFTLNDNSWFFKRKFN